MIKMSKTNTQTKLYTLNTNELVYKKGIKREDFKNSFEYLIARDGFIFGCDYDWPTCWEYVDHCLGDNHIQFDGKQTATYNHYQAFTDISNIRAIGFNAVNYWVLSSMQGVQFDDEGYCIGLDKGFTDNIRDICQICREIGIFLVPSMQSHGSANSWGSFNSKGESPVYVWNKYFKYIWDEKAREMYLKNVIEPICQIFAEYQDTLLCVGLTVENSTGSVSDMDIGYYQGEQGTTWEVWVDYINSLHDCVKKYAPNLLTSTEEAGGVEKLCRLSEVKVDLIGGNYYHAGAYVPPRELYVTGRPGYIGEYNVADYHGNTYQGMRWGAKRHEFLKNAREAGWIGAFYFRYSCDWGDCTIFDPNGTILSYEHLYRWGWEFRHHILDYIAEHRKEKDEVEAPSLFANRGTDDIFWIPSRSGNVYMLERSDDGGKTWTVVDDNIIAEEHTANNGLIKYIDKTTHKGMEFCYRVTVKTGDGKTATSVPNNIREYYAPENLLKNGKFENCSFDGWDINKYSGKTERIDDLDCLLFDFADEETTTNYGGISQTLKLKPGTAYVVSYKYKNLWERTPGEPPYVAAYDVNRNTRMALNYISHLATDDDKYAWKTGILSFVTTSDGEDVKITLCQGSKKTEGKIYFTDIEVTELR